MVKRIAVDLAEQQLSAYEGNKLVYRFNCVTGDNQHPTDPGTFRVIWKDRNHFSQAYQVPMHFALFFSDDGKAIHQFFLPDWLLALDRLAKTAVTNDLGSHGCVRLTEPDASSLFDWASVGTPVVIAGSKRAKVTT